MYGWSFSEGLLTAISVHLIRRFGEARPQGLTSPCGGVPEHRLQRVKEHVEANLGEDLSIAAMAQVAGLSPYHFCRILGSPWGKAPPTPPAATDRAGETALPGSRA